MKILTWHVHGNYLLYLTRFSKHEFYLPTNVDGEGGRGHVFPFVENVKDIPADRVRKKRFDCILYQHERNWSVDRHSILSDDQMRLPSIFLEHDPPLEHPSEQLHPVADEKDILLVHVTPFNALAWNNGDATTMVIDHGAFLMNEANATHERPRGITAVNDIATRGRRAGGDVYKAMVGSGVSLDLIGMNSQAVGGLGEVSPPELAAFISKYRFYFNPSRYTSLNLAVIEAMLVGLPIVGLATTEMPTVIVNGASGFIETDPSKLLEPMRELIASKTLAGELGQAAKRYASERFNIHRFTEDWDRAITFATSGRRSTNRAL